MSFTGRTRIQAYEHQAMSMTDADLAAEHEWRMDAYKFPIAGDNCVEPEEHLRIANACWQEMWRRAGVRMGGMHPEADLIREHNRQQRLRDPSRLP